MAGDVTGDNSDHFFIPVLEQTAGRGPELGLGKMAATLSLLNGWRTEVLAKVCRCLKVPPKR